MTKKNKEFVVKATKKNQKFDTGMVRGETTGKPRPDLISPLFIKRLGMHMSKGVEHYGSRNWELGSPMSRTLESLCRHVEDLKEGLQDEDHLAAIAFNTMVLIHYQEMIARGLLPKEYDDLPCYVAPEK